MLQDSGFTDVEVSEPVDTFGGAKGEGKARAFEVYGTHSWHAAPPDSSDLLTAIAAACMASPGTRLSRRVSGFHGPRWRRGRDDRSCMIGHTRRDRPGCRSPGRSVVAGIRSGTRTGLRPTPDPRVTAARPQFRSMRRPRGQPAAGAYLAQAWRVSSYQAVASGRSSRTSCAQRHATAILAAHSSASSREGTSTTANPQMTSLVSGYGPSVTVPSVATTLALCFPARRRRPTRRRPGPP